MSRAVPHAPTFLVGAERSGTTLFRLLVDSHPDITCIEGLDYVISAVEPDGSRPSLADYVDDLATETVYSTSGFTIDPSLDHFDAVVDDFLTQRMVAAGKPQVAALLHNGLATALDLWPKARFIHLVRDPRAVALSTKPFEWGGHVSVGIQKWIDLMDEWSELSTTLPSDRWMTIDFAELVTDHESTLERVCAFMGRAYDPAMLSYVEETDYEAPIPSKATEWQDRITDDEIRIVETCVGERLLQMGFEPSGFPPKVMSSRELGIMKAQLRTKKWRHKLTSHGWVAVAELATRKIGIDALHRPMKQRMNADERESRKRSWREPGREYAYSPARARELAASAATT